jgi:hypothetical protein
MAANTGTCFINNKDKRLCEIYYIFEISACHKRIAEVADGIHGMPGKRIICRVMLRVFHTN